MVRVMVEAREQSYVYGLNSISFTFSVIFFDLFGYICSAAAQKRDKSKHFRSLNRDVDFITFRIFVFPFMHEAQ